MKQWLILVSFIMTPLLSFSAQPAMDIQLNTAQELCAKARDPLVREQYCRMLDQYEQSSQNKEVVTV